MFENEYISSKNNMSDSLSSDQYDNFDCISSSLKSTADFDLFGQTAPSPQRERKSVTFKEDIEEKYISDRKGDSQTHTKPL